MILFSEFGTLVSIEVFSWPLQRVRHTCTTKKGHMTHISWLNDFKSVLGPTLYLILHDLQSCNFVWRCILGSLSASYPNKVTLTYILCFIDSDSLLLPSLVFLYCVSYDNLASCVDATFTLVYLYNPYLIMYIVNC